MSIGNGLKRLLLTSSLMLFISFLFTGCGELEQGNLKEAGNYATASPMPTISSESKKKGSDVRDEQSAREYLDKQEDSNGGAANRAKESEEKIRKDTEKEYYALLDKYSDNDTETSDRGFIETILYHFYRIYLQIKMYAAPITFVSIIIGSLIAIFCRSNKAMRRFGIFGLIIGVPVIMILMVYGVGILNSIFLN